MPILTVVIFTKETGDGVVRQPGRVDIRVECDGKVLKLGKIESVPLLVLQVVLRK